MYRRRFPMTHREYLDEPDHAVRWMNEIDRIYRRIEEQRQQRRPGGSGGR